MSYPHVRRAGALVLFLATAAAQAAQTTCPPLGELPTYQLRDDGLRLRNHDMHRFPIADPETGVDWKEIAGRYCQAIYVPKDDDALMSDLEIQENYRAQMRALGATVLNTDQNSTSARLDKDGAKTWFYSWSQESQIEVTVVREQAAAQVLTAPGASDHRLFGHMPGFVADKPERRNFDQATLRVRDGDDEREVSVQGARFSVAYRADEQTPPTADADIHANYRAAVQKLGGEVLYADPNWTSARLIDQGQVVWLSLYSQETLIELNVIEEKPFQASITPPQADALRTALDRDGRIALYIQFDFAKATLKADAQPLIGQVAAMLRADPALRLSVEGHTDDIGGAEANRTLSQQRAQGVVAALAAQGIAAERLTAAGFGADKPLAGNDSSEGRAKNRRVELVRR